MDIVVQKYGGTSVENKEKLEIVCNRIGEKLKQNNKVVVVVSAQGKTTDKLILKSKDYVIDNYPEEMDMLLATGEMQTVALLSMLLKEKEYKVCGLTGKQAGIVTDSKHMSASIIDVLQDNILNKLEENDIVIVAGFQGADKYGNITTLGRGGSDLSAVAIASSLGAKCEIYTDVDGIYTGNPKIIPEAKLLSNISYNEMLEAASNGAKVLHNRSVGMAKEYNVPILVRNANKNDGGTIVENVTQNVKENYSPKIIVIEEDLSKVSIVGEGLQTNTEYMNIIYRLATEMGIKIYMISISEISINIIIKKDLVKEFANKINEEIFI